MNDYIGRNIKFLCDRYSLSQDEFGAQFGLNKSVVGTYVRGISHPKIDTIQKICSKYQFSMDDFVNHDLSEKYTGHTPASEMQKVMEEAAVYKAENAALLRTIEAQRDTIEAMRVTIDTLLKR
ncbi:helix-turn-helix domain-containing protein [Flavobacterium beibuense]|uniref:helix-turn-helix domain-containing protein n=1 Tax=Flavobacterium beibuense TaxID=657326 RepID=UPI003A91223F